MNGRNQIELRSFPRQYDERFRGVARRLYGVPVDLTGDGWMQARVLDHSALILNGFSLQQVRGLLAPHTATHLFARRYTEDSLGALVELTLADELPRTEAVYVAADDVAKVLAAHERYDSHSEPFDPLVRDSWALVLDFLRRAQRAGDALLCFSELSDREYE